MELADGSFLECNKKVQKLQLQIQDYEDQLNFSVMPLSHYDMILGQSWLFQYDSMISFRALSIQFYHDGRELTLQGLFSTKLTTFVLALQVRKRDCTTALVMLRAIEVEEESSTSSSPVAYLEQPFFKPYQDLFPDELPTTLPPCRLVDHPIELVPGHPPPTRAPYRVSYSESQEIQRQ